MYRIHVHYLGMLSFILFASGCGSTAFAQPSLPGERKPVTELRIDTARSVIHWRGTEMWGTGKHEGTVRFESGHLIYTKKRLIGGRLKADMNSIEITDIPEHDPIPRRNLRNHLKSEDFFLTEQYPVAVFEVADAEMLTEHRLKVTGNLTIRDVTGPIEVIAQNYTDREGRTGYRTDFTVDRFKFNIAYQDSYWERITSILDNSLVDSEIQLSIRLIMKQPDFAKSPK